jgi:spoIIIJ-associated protein
MEWVEITGKTVEEARGKALELLGVAEEEAEVEILAEAKMGLFGRVREEARVRARVEPSVPRSKEDGNRKRRSGGRPAKEAPAAADDAAPAPPAAEPEPRPERQKPVAARAREPRAPGGSDRRAGGRATVAVAENGANVEGTMSEDVVEVPLAEQAEVAREFLDGLLAIMAMEGASTEVVLLDEDTAEVQVSAAEPGLLIGHQGATLLALQDLARTVVQRRTGARTGRLLLDVAGYRQKRKEALERFTQKVADEVIAAGTPIALEPMSSADRKIVHDMVNSLDGVTTTSEGEDPRRRVVVHPA